jgi:hypothetical protein
MRRRLSLRVPFLVAGTSGTVDRSLFAAVITISEYAVFELKLKSAEVTVPFALCFQPPLQLLFAAAT